MIPVSLGLSSGYRISLFPFFFGAIHDPEYKSGIPEICTLCHFFFIRPEFRPSPLIGCVFVNNIRFTQKEKTELIIHHTQMKKKKANCIKIAAALLTPFSSIDTQKKTARSYLNGQKLQRPVHTRPPNIGSSAPSVVFTGVKVFHPKIFFLSLLHIFCGGFFGRNLLNSPV